MSDIQYRQKKVGCFMLNMFFSLFETMCQCKMFCNDNEDKTRVMLLSYILSFRN